MKENKLGIFVRTEIAVFLLSGPREIDPDPAIL